MVGPTIAPERSDPSARQSHRGNHSLGSAGASPPGPQWFLLRPSCVGSMKISMFNSCNFLSQNFLMVTLDISRKRKEEGKKNGGMGRKKRGKKKKDVYFSDTLKNNRCLRKIDNLLSKLTCPLVLNHF